MQAQRSITLHNNELIKSYVKEVKQLNLFFQKIPRGAIEDVYQTTFRLLGNLENNNCKK